MKLCRTLAGLLHDLGCLLLGFEQGLDSLRLLRGLQCTGFSLCFVYRSLATHHCDSGSMVVERRE